MYDCLAYVSYLVRVNEQKDPRSGVAAARQPSIERLDRLATPARAAANRTPGPVRKGEFIGVLRACWFRPVGGSAGQAT